MNLSGFGDGCQNLQPALESTLTSLNLWLVCKCLQVHWIENSGKQWFSRREAISFSIYNLIYVMDGAGYNKTLFDCLVFNWDRKPETMHDMIHMSTETIDLEFRHGGVHFRYRAFQIAPLALLLVSFFPQWTHWVCLFQKAHVILFGHHNLLCCVSKIAIQTGLHLKAQAQTHTGLRARTQSHTLLHKLIVSCYSILVSFSLLPLCHYTNLTKAQTL